MTTAIMFKTDPATRRTMKCMLIAFGLLLNAPALAAADSELSQTYSACMDKSKGVTRWGNGPAAAQAARLPQRDGVLAQWRSSLKLMVSLTGVEACSLQASSRDDHEALCRN